MRANPNGQLARPRPEILPGNTVIVSIGRNTAAEPLSLDDWLSFRAETHEAIRCTVGAPDTSHNGVGIWNGVREDSTIFTVFQPAPYLVALSTRLGEVAARYRQGAIALTIGQPLFVSAAAGDDAVPAARSESASVTEA